MSVKGITHLIGSEHAVTLTADTVSFTIITRCKLDDASTVFTAYHWRAKTLIVLWAFLCRHAKGTYKACTMKAVLKSLKNNNKKQTVVAQKSLRHH